MGNDDLNLNEEYSGPSDDELKDIEQHCLQKMKLKH